jgi:TonB family protein
MNHRVQVRAAQDHLLRESLAGSSMSALTVVVAAMLASVLLAPKSGIIVCPGPTWDPPPRDDRRYVPVPDVSFFVPLSDVFQVRPTEEEVVIPTLEVPPSVATGSGDGGLEVQPDVSIGGGTGSGTIAPPTPVIPPPTEWIPHDELPVVAHRVLPEYPDVPRNAGMEGKVMVQIYVGLDGKVHRAHVVGKASIFDEAALSAVRQWVFTPAKANGHPVAVWMAVPVVFRLH